MNHLGAVRRRGRTDGEPSDPTAEDEVGELSVGFMAKEDRV